MRLFPKKFPVQVKQHRNESRGKKKSLENYPTKKWEEMYAMEHRTLSSQAKGK